MVWFPQGSSDVEVEGPISLGWKSDLTKGVITTVLENRSETLINKENEINQAVTPDSEVSFRRTSNRQKKVPVTRKNDFLW